MFTLRSDPATLFWSLQTESSAVDLIHIDTTLVIVRVHCFLEASMHLINEPPLIFTIFQLLADTQSIKMLIFIALFLFDFDGAS